MGGMVEEEEPNAMKVRVDGEEALLHITDQSVLFERGGRVSGFERSAIRLVKPDGDAMIIAYSVGNEVKSVKVEPMIAVASLVASPSTSFPTQAPMTTLDEVFDKLYGNARKELEGKLTKVQGEPENKNLRLSQEEEARFADISRQMENVISTKHGFKQLDAENTPISFWGLEKQTEELQLEVVKIRHIRFLRLIVGPKAEQSDIVYSTDEVWPQDWPRILERFNLGNDLYVTKAFNGYVDFLNTRWECKPGVKKPALARP
jgi:hypothetical protein